MKRGLNQVEEQPNKGLGVKGHGVVKELPKAKTEAVNPEYVCIPSPLPKTVLKILPYCSNNSALPSASYLHLIPQSS